MARAVQGVDFKALESLKLTLVENIQTMNLKENLLTLPSNLGVTEFMISDLLQSISVPELRNIIICIDTAYPYGITAGLPEGRMYLAIHWDTLDCALESAVCHSEFDAF